MIPTPRSGMLQRIILAHSSVAIASIPCSAAVQACPCSFSWHLSNVHDAPSARPLLAWAILLYRLRPRIIRLDAGYWGLRLIAWIHTVLGAVAVVPWNPKRQRNRSCLPRPGPPRNAGLRTNTLRFFGRVFSLFSSFRLQRPPLCGWSAVARRVALTYAGTSVVALAAYQAGRPDLIRSPTRVLAHLWEPHEGSS